MSITHHPRRGLALLLSWAIIAACSSVGTAGTAVPEGETSAPSSGHPLSSPSTTMSPASSPSESPVSTIATTACSALLDEIPQVRVLSGRATLAGAYAVNGDQVADYLEYVHIAVGRDENTPSVWRDSASQDVVMCIFDGDFSTMTPGPPGHDTSAVRVLVVIADRLADLWAVARTDASTLPTSDPATIPH